MNTKIIEYVLRIAVAGEFLGHSFFALWGGNAGSHSVLAFGPKREWITWIQQFGFSDFETAKNLLILVGLMDLVVAFIILIRPIRIVLLWAVFWGFWTALVRPLVGLSVFDFIERWANWGAPLALLLVIGWPKSLKEWLR